jgi:phosphoenolpyruvate carboxykinase (ATP)
MAMDYTKPFYPPKVPVEQQGIQNYIRIFYNPTNPQLYEQAIRRQEGLLARLGPLVVRTGHYTGRAPNDKFIVNEASSADKVWWGEVNRPFALQHFDRLHQRLRAHLQGKEIYVQDCYAGADPEYRVPIRVITEMAWQSLFARNMFIRIYDREVLAQFEPEYTVIAAPQFHANPETDGTHSEAFILVHFDKKLILIGGTGYGGEIKKSIFTMMNYLLPQRSVMPMHCSANVGRDGSAAIFFGLSGTGKTSLSADPERQLVGDDEHGWSDNGIFNFEGGCYAKVIRLSPQAEPQIYRCTQLFGTILENVAMDSHTRRLDLDDATLTENTRAAYPIYYIDHASPTGMAPHPRNIIMLTCDAFGVLPPIARLTPEQAMYHFLSGYTAKVAGTEAGVVEPQATFSTCFGAPFMALPPTVYAELLRERINKHRSDCWLINTGWSGGAYGTGQRISIAHTRAMVHAALNSKLNGVEFFTEPYFGLSIPRHCPGVPALILNPADTWRNQDAYRLQAEELRNRFRNNFKPFEAAVEAGVRGVM